MGKPSPSTLTGEFPLHPFPHGHLAQPDHPVHSLIREVLLSTYYVSSTVLGWRITTENETDTAPAPLNGAYSLVQKETLSTAIHKR